MRYRRVAITSASSLAGKAVIAVTTLVSVPIAFNYLGREQFGLWAALSTLLGFLALGDLGIGNALVNATARSMGRDERRMTQQAVASAFYILCVQALLVVLVFLVLANYVDWARLFNVRSDAARAEIGKAMAALVGVIALQLPATAVQRLHEGLQEGYVSNLLQATASLVGLLGLIIVVHFQLGLAWVIIAVGGAPVCVAAINSFVQFGIVRPWLSPRLSHFDRTMGLDLLRAGSIFFVLAFLTFWGIYSDNLIISRMLDSAAVTEYAVMQRLSMLAHLFWAFIIPLWPAYAEAISRGDYEWIRKTFKWCLKASFAMGLVVGIGLAVFGPDIVRVWIGADFDLDPSLLYGFSFYIMISGVIGSIAVVMNAGPFLRSQLWILAFAAVTALSLKIILCIRYGVSGVIWATVIGFTLFYILPGLWMIERFISSKSRAEPAC